MNNPFNPHKIMNRKINNNKVNKSNKNSKFY